MKTMLHWDRKNFWELWILKGSKLIATSPLSVAMATDIARAHGKQLPEVAKGPINIRLE